MFQKSEQRIYCGDKEELPEGYDRFGKLSECLRKGYGACLYKGKQGEKACRKQTGTRKIRIYCGNQPDLPEDYDRFGTRFGCLRKGFGACLYNDKKTTTKKKNEWLDRFWQDHFQKQMDREDWDSLFLSYPERKRASLFNAFILEPVDESVLYRLLRKD